MHRRVSTIITMNTTMTTETASAEDQLLRYFPACLTRVLDCACGPAARVSEFRSRGAIEVQAVAHTGTPQECQEYDAVHACDLVVDPLPYPAQHFDFILCHDVLARLRDPEPLLRRLRPLLAPEGALLVTVPNLQNHPYVVGLVEGRWSHEPEGALARPHIRFFTGSELLRLLQKTGYQVQRTSALRFDPPEDFPRDPDTIVRLGRIHIGPLSDDEYRQYLVREYAFLARVADQSP